MKSVSNILFTLLLAHTLCFAYSRHFYQYVSPEPNSIHNPVESSILVRFQTVSPQELGNLSDFILIKGEKSGYLAGTIRVASDGRTVIFKPDHGFSPGETVSVLLQPRSFSGTPLEQLKYVFSVSAICDKNLIVEPDELIGIESAKPAAPVIRQAQIMPNGVSVPSDFPHMQVMVNNNPHSDYIWLNNWGDQPFNVIFDTDGNPVWYRRFNDRRRDFKLQKNGVITMLKRDGGTEFVGFDKSFNELGRYFAVDGYGTDEHELQVLEDGTYFLIGRKNDTVDMSKYVSGGQKNATVRETVVQGFTPAGEKIFQWRAWDNFDIRDVKEENLQGNHIRFPHMNAVDIDYDGHILLSSRHLSEITKIDRQTGEIIWRLGGAHNEFTFVDDPLNGPEMQHDVRVVGANRYTVFDNGNWHEPSESRVPEWEIDTEKMTATLVWQYRHSPRRYSHWMGNSQRLPNGNQHINWADGSLPKVTEVTRSGEKVLEMQWVNGYHSYRVLRCPWDGVVKAPYLLIEPAFNNITLIFNKFGDPDVEHYNIYAGRTRNPTELFAASGETLVKLTDFPVMNRRYYFRVTAVDANGNESAYSNEVDAVVNFSKPGDNLIINGNFGREKEDWIWQVRGGADAEWRVSNGVTHFDINDGGSEFYEVQLRQNGIPLENGKDYIFEFDAWADAPRQIEAKVSQDQGPWTNYSKIGLSYITTRKKRYSFSFTMEDPSDFDSRVVFNAGTTADDLYLDNIEVKQVVSSGVRQGHLNVSDYRLLGNYPNPFNPQTTICFSLAKQSRVKISVYNLLGELQDIVCQTDFQAGRHEVNYDARRLASGVYFYHMLADTPAGVFQNVRKMVVVK